MSFRPFHGPQGRLVGRQRQPELLQRKHLAAEPLLENRLIGRETLGLGTDRCGVELLAESRRRRGATADSLGGGMPSPLTGTSSAPGGRPSPPGGRPSHGAGGSFAASPSPHRVAAVLVAPVRSDRFDRSDRFLPISLGRIGQRGQQRFAPAQALAGGGNRLGKGLRQRILRQAALAAPLHHAGVVVGVDAGLQPLEHLPPHGRHLVQRPPLVRLGAVGHQLFFPDGQDPLIALVRRKVAGDLRQGLEDRQPLFRHGDPHAPFDAHELLALGLDHRLPRRHDGRLAARRLPVNAFSSRAKAFTRRRASSTRSCRLCRYPWGKLAAVAARPFSPDRLILPAERWMRCRSRSKSCTRCRASTIRCRCCSAGGKLANSDSFQASTNCRSACSLASPPLLRSLNTRRNLVQACWRQTCS